MYLIDTVAEGSWEKFANACAHMLLPAFCLSYVYLAIITRIVRSSMISVMGLDFVTTARANGIRRGGGGSEARAEERPDPRGDDHRSVDRRAAGRGDTHRDHL